MMKNWIRLYYKLSLVIVQLVEMENVIPGKEKRN